MKRIFRLTIIAIQCLSGLMLSGCQKDNTSVDPKALEEIFHFVALEDGLKVSLEIMEEKYPRMDLSLLYSLDGQNWVDFIAGQSVATLPKSGDKLYMKANKRNTSFSLVNPDLDSTYFSNGYTFKLSKKTKVCGNIMYLLDGNHPEDAEMGEYTFECLFLGDSLLMDASELLLPAQRLNYGCYTEMFEGTSISKAPELPATEMKKDCYRSMFLGCRNLKTAPELPATKLDTSCYNGMFFECTLLTKAPELPSEQLVSGCYSFMFYGCTSLITGPKLPAAKLTEYCYYRMFEGCTSMTNLTCSGTDLSAEKCIDRWMDNVKTNGTFHAVSGTDWTGKIPASWKVEY